MGRRGGGGDGETLDVKVEGESCRRTKKKGVLGRRPRPSEVTQEASRMSSKKKALHVAFGRPPSPSQGPSPPGSSQGMTRGEVSLWRGDGGYARQERPRHRLRFKMQVRLSLAGSLYRSGLNAQTLYFTAQGVRRALTSLYFYNLVTLCPCLRS